MSRRDPKPRTTRTGRVLNRVIQQRRKAKPETPSDANGAEDESRIVALEQRVEELEALVEGLQDSVHREMSRQGAEIAEIAERIQAPEMARALGKYSRERRL